MSWPWLTVLLVAVGLVVAAEWPRIQRRVGSEARARRERERRKGKLRVVEPEDDSDEFIRSVTRDLERLPTIEERDRT
jgi:hypothetical protein